MYKKNFQQCNIDLEALLVRKHPYIYTLAELILKIMNKKYIFVLIERIRQCTSVYAAHEELLSNASELIRGT